MSVHVVSTVEGGAGHQSDNYIKKDTDNNLPPPPKAENQVSILKQINAVYSMIFWRYSQMQMFCKDDEEKKCYSFL